MQYIPPQAPIVQISHRGSGRKDGDHQSRVIVLNAVPYPYTDGYRLMAEVSRPEWDELNGCVVFETVTLDCLVTSDDQVVLLAQKHYPGWALGATWLPEEESPF